jgi:hypothetical protein
VYGRDERKRGEMVRVCHCGYVINDAGDDFGLCLKQTNFLFSNSIIVSFKKLYFVRNVLPKLIMFILAQFGFVMENSPLLKYCLQINEYFLNYRLSNLLVTNIRHLQMTQLNLYYDAVNTNLDMYF